MNYGSVCSGIEVMPVAIPKEEPTPRTWQPVSQMGWRKVLPAVGVGSPYPGWQPPD
jgi:hypothetical protein